MPPEATALFALGVINGATVCSLTCLPLLGPYLMGTGNGFQEGVGSSLIFLLGKLFTYTLLGGVAAFLGHLFLPESAGWLRYVIGLPLIAAGLSIPLVSKKGCSLKVCRVGKRVSLFTLGACTSLVPCPQLAAVFLIAAREGSVSSGMGCGLLYSLGLLVSPLLIIGGGLSAIAEKIRLETGRAMSCVRAVSVLLLVLMGIKVLLET